MGILFEFSFLRSELLFSLFSTPDVVVPPAIEHQGESTESDSDDCIVQAQTTGRKVGV